MTEYVVTPPPVTSVAVAGTKARFPVRRVFCVGANYVAHAKEMGRDPSREPPFFFLKPADAVLDAGGNIPYPPDTTNFHYEIELVVAIGKGGTNIPPEKSREHIYGYSVGIDLTRRDLQLHAREKGRPWDWGKGFDLSGPTGPIFPVSAKGHIDKGRIWLAVNGAIKQDSDIAALIWSTEDIISFISRSMDLKEGDLIFTGTPAGVGPIVKGDHVTAGIEGLDEIEIRIV